MLCIYFILNKYFVIIKNEWNCVVDCPVSDELVNLDLLFGGN